MLGNVKFSGNQEEAAAVEKEGLSGRHPAALHSCSLPTPTETFSTRIIQECLLSSTEQAFQYDIDIDLQYVHVVEVHTSCEQPTLLSRDNRLVYESDN